LVMNSITIDDKYQTNPFNFNFLGKGCIIEIASGENINNRQNGEVSIRSDYQVVKLTSNL